MLLGRKVMTNLDSVLKSRDITLPTKVPLVKAMVFPVVMYGYVSLSHSIIYNIYSYIYIKPSLLSLHPLISGYELDYCVIARTE